MGIGAALGGFDAGMGLISGLSRERAMERAASINETTQMLRIQTAKTREAEQLNKTAGADMVAESSSGIALGSGSITALNRGSLTNYDRDQNNYNLDSKLAQMNESAEFGSARSELMSSTFGGLREGLQIGIDTWGAGDSPSGSVSDFANPSGSDVYQPGFGYNNDQALFKLPEA
ncbi:MAG: hypothetical protein KAI17_03320 [Thiotrichaceae bacterium]|nr:hypothetical protein [Thiotrichaceae bacterium]